MNIKIIVNPLAGCGKAREIGFFVEKFLCERGIEYSLDSTYRPLGAISLSKKAVQGGFNLIIAVGGDGTVNEVAHGMIGSLSRLAIIPAGNKNDFAKTLCIPISNLEEACEVAIGDAEKIVDIGNINDKYFLNGVQIGLNAELIRSQKKHSRFLRGRVGEAIRFARTITKFKSAQLKIKMGDVYKEAKTISLTVGNGRYFNGGYNLIPHADVNDNLFDICLARYPGKAKFLFNIPKIFNGSHTKLSFFSFLKTKNLEIDFDVPVSAVYDGEHLEDKSPYKISMCKYKLPVKTLCKN